MELVEEGKAYLTVIYNIGLIAILAITLGLLMGKISDLIGYNKQATDEADSLDEVDAEK